MSSFFPRFPALPSHDLAPFFRILDASDPFVLPYSRSGNFMPRFDVRERDSSYELQGELPGIKQEDIDIEFVDANTLVIRGKTERSSNSTETKDKAVKKSETSEPVTADHASEKSTSSYQKATVEDEYVDAGEAVKESDSAAASDTAAVTSSAARQDYKYWVNERSVGEFQRRFQFPGRVDQEAVKASLKNGILSIIVPKVVKAEKKITIE